MAMVLLAGVFFAFITVVSNSTAVRDARKTLQRVVEDNVKEVEYDDGKLDWHEISRFATRQSEYNGVLWWDYNHIFDFVDKAVATAVNEGVESVGIDTWGCDFALVDGDKVVVPPLYYRDRHIFGAAEKASDKMPFEWLYSKTGIQKMDINTVYRFDVLDNLSPGWRTAGGHALLIRYPYSRSWRTIFPSARVRSMSMSRWLALPRKRRVRSRSAST